MTEEILSFVLVNTNNNAKYFDWPKIEWELRKNRMEGRIITLERRTKKTTTRNKKGERNESMKWTQEKKCDKK